MNGGGDRDELGESGSPEDALVEIWEVHHQELGLDGSGRYPLQKVTISSTYPHGFVLAPLKP